VLKETTTPKHYSNEIVKFFGSIVELTIYKLTGQLALNTPKLQQAQKIVKNSFTWKI
jgi:hypothetical protein